jgi:DNA-binding response OmpR family regulator
MNATVDLTNCDREPIHLLGSIQPFGFLLGVSREWIVIRAPENVDCAQYFRAPTVNEALRLVEKSRPGFALLDVNLGSESSFPVADRLVALGVPVVVATGYGKKVQFPERFADIPVVSKPYSAESLVAKIVQAFAGHEGAATDGS